MSTDNSQKICIECRALVPLDSGECPECGYPFDDTGTTRCRSCSSIIVDDVQQCPVCGQETAVLREESSVPRVDLQQVHEEAPTPVVTVPVELSQAVPGDVQEVVADNTAVPGSFESMAATVQKLTAAVQAQNRFNEELVRAIKDSGAAVKNSISESQSANQRALNDAMAAIKVIKEHSNDTIADQLTELKVAISESAAQQTASANLLMAAVKENSDKTATAIAAIKMPASLKWLDYMLIAIIVMLIFSIGNLLVMAYIARLLMMQE